MNHFDGKESELVIGKLRGFRSWKATTFRSYDFINWNKLPWGRHSRLASVSINTWWPVNNMQAKCQIRIPKSKNKDYHSVKYPHQAPTDGCTCGIYGHYNLDATVGYGIGMQSSIYGSFDAWGKVLLGTSGFRCQYAKVTALVSNQDLVRLKHIASYYGVPYFYDYEEFELAFPPISLNNILYSIKEVR